MDTSASILDLVDKRDFEWLAWNYRTFKFEQMFISKKDMVFQMFNKTFSFLPSQEEILYGIIKAQIDYSKSRYKSVKNFKLIIDSTIKIWNKIFQLAKLEDMKKPLTPQILSNPNSDFVKTILYIYSMESFIFGEMNKASRNKDKSKI